MAKSLADFLAGHTAAEQQAEAERIHEAVGEW